MYDLTKQQLAEIIGVKALTIEDVLKEIELAKYFRSNYASISDEDLYNRLKMLNGDESSRYHELFEKLAFENNEYDGKELRTGRVYVEDGNCARYYDRKSIWDEIESTWIDNNRLDDLIDEYGSNAKDEYAGCPAVDSLEYNDGYERELQALADIMYPLDGLDIEREMNYYIDALLEIADELEAEESNNQ